MKLRESIINLHSAAKLGSVAAVREKLKAELDINGRDEWRRSPLQVAIEAGHTEVARWLIEHGADPNALDSRKQTPLHAASTRGLTEIVELLLDSGANPYLRDGRNKTPLQLAEEYGHRDVERLIHDIEFQYFKRKWPNEEAEPALEFLVVNCCLLSGDTKQAKSILKDRFQEVFDEPSRRMGRSPEAELPAARQRGARGKEQTSHAERLANQRGQDEPTRRG